MAEPKPPGDARYADINGHLHRLAPGDTVAVKAVVEPDYPGHVDAPEFVDLYAIAKHVNRLEETAPWTSSALREAYEQLEEAADGYMKDTCPAHEAEPYIRGSCTCTAETEVLDALARVREVKSRDS